jgi:hypothetical protein
VNVGRDVEAATVPGFGSVGFDLAAMADQLPVGEVLEDGALVLCERAMSMSS